MEHCKGRYCNTTRDDSAWCGVPTWSMRTRGTAWGSKKEKKKTKDFGSYQVNERVLKLAVIVTPSEREEQNERKDLLCRSLFLDDSGRQGIKDERSQGIYWKA